MAKFIRAKAKQGAGLEALPFSPVPLVTGTTPAHPIIKKREEKSDRNLLQIYLDNHQWYRAVGSKRAAAASALLSWKIDSLGGMGAAW